MGQEASVPLNESLDEQARAPPSTPDQHNQHDNLSLANGVSNGRSGGLMYASTVGQGQQQPYNQNQQPKAPSSRKIMGAMFRGSGTTGSHSVSNLYHQNQQNSDDYEQREISRNAATGGHLYDSTSDDCQSSSESCVATYSGIYSNDLQVDSLASINAPLPLQYSESHQPPQQQAGLAVVQSNQGQVGVFYDKPSSSSNVSSRKGGIFSSRSTRGVINSMRNLSIASALRGGKQQNYRQKEVADWEKQWDEDDDNDEDEDGENDHNDDTSSLPQSHVLGGDASVSSPSTISPISGPTQQYQNVNAGAIEQYGNGIRFISTSTPGSPNKSQSPQSPVNQQSTNIQTGLDYGQSSIQPQSLQSIVTGSHLSPLIPHQEQFASPGLSPPHMQQSLQGNVSHLSNSCQGGLGVPSMSQAQQHPVPDLLLQPALTHDTHLSSPPPQQLHVIEDDAIDWETCGGNQQVVVGDESSKPTVEMFMPMLRVLGKGSFGKVVLVQKREGKERGQLFAMKILKKTHLVKRRQIERTRTERKVLAVVNHPFIMKLHYAFQTENKLYLVLDYCPGGELFFHLSRFRRFPERVARFYAAELLLAIGHLHKRGIIYRDLKPENVLLDAEGHLKLGDFGLAKAGITHPLTGATSMCGTPEYMAPEVLAQTGHGFCVDYWGLGMLVYEMMTGLPPWYTTDRAQLFRRLKSAPLEIPTFFSAASANCVCSLLERNPRRRLGVSGIRIVMEHEFFRNISWRALYSRRVEAPVRPCEGWKPPEPVQDRHNTGTYDNNAAAMPTKVTPQQFGIEELDNTELDAATQNFDNQFTRMPVESEELGFDLEKEGIGAEELDNETFLGFSFDIVKHREEEALALAGITPAGAGNSMSSILPV